MNWSEEVYPGVWLQYQREDGHLIISVVVGDDDVLWFKTECLIWDYQRDLKGRLRLTNAISMALQVAGEGYQRCLTNHKEASSSE